MNKLRPYRQKIITDKSQVPAGFVRTSVLFPISVRKAAGADRYVPEYRQLTYDAQMGKIPSVKLMRYPMNHSTGPVYVDRLAAQKYLDAFKKRTTPVKPTTSSEPKPEAAATPVQSAINESKPGLTVLSEILETQQKMAQTLDALLRVWQPTQGANTNV